MNDVVRTFAITWLLTQIASLLMLEAGTRFAGNRLLMRLGEISHRQKMSALERIRPLTRIPDAVARGDTLTCTVILASLIALKSAASLVFGIVMVFWLPLASVLVPSIVAVHDPDDPSLGPWVRRVAALQVTSHALAAALGFALVLAGPLADRSIAEAIDSNVGLLVVASLASLGFAFAAGRAEASGVVKRGF